MARLDKGEHVTRSHAYVETFHHLTGRGLPLKNGQRVAVTPKDAAAMIRRLAAKVPARDLDPEQILKALDDAQRRGVKGRLVHDWIHARAAKLAKADLIVSKPRITRMTRIKHRDDRNIDDRNIGKRFIGISYSCHQFSCPGSPVSWRENRK